MRSVVRQWQRVNRSTCFDKSGELSDKPTNNCKGREREEKEKRKTKTGSRKHVPFDAQRVEESGGQRLGGRELEHLAEEEVVRASHADVHSLLERAPQLQDGRVSLGRRRRCRARVPGDRRANAAPAARLAHATRHRRALLAHVQTRVEPARSVRLAAI